MHWLKKFRLYYQNEDGSRGISQEELAKKIKLKHGKCSATLIGIIEAGGITQPNIANQIAVVAGASIEQRDSMVHKSRQGGWTPPKPKRRSDHKKLPQPLAPGVISDNAQRVVAIDIYGNEVGRFESISAAAAEAGCTPSTVSNRCNRTMSPRTGEFRFFDCTWRFADEWDSMSEDARKADIENALFIQKGRKKNAKQVDAEPVPEACPAHQPG